jgi:hypothetical protein
MSVVNIPPIMATATHLDQLENERGELYYRACKGSVCRYAEDHYIAVMYLEGMGWDPTQASPSVIQTHNRILPMRLPKRLFPVPLQPILRRLRDIARKTASHQGSAGAYAHHESWDARDPALPTAPGLLRNHSTRTCSSNV